LERSPTGVRAAELNNMIAYDVFAPTLKKTANVIPSSLIVKPKLKGDKMGYKARLVAGGHRESIDLLMDRYAPTVDSLTSRCVCFPKCGVLKIFLVLLHSLLCFYHGM
jgi:hypothetical protein